MSRIGKAPCSVERTSFFDLLSSDQLGSILSFARPLKIRGILEHTDLRHLSQVCRTWHAVIRKLVEDIHCSPLSVETSLRALREGIVLDDPDNLRVDLFALPAGFFKYEQCSSPPNLSPLSSPSSTSAVSTGWTRFAGIADDVHASICDIMDGAVPKLVAGASTLTLKNRATGPGLRVLCSWLGPSLSSLVLTHHSMVAVATGGGSVYDDTLLTLRSSSTLRTLALVNVDFEEQQIVFDDFCSALASSSLEVLRVTSIKRVFRGGGSDSSLAESDSDYDSPEQELLGLDELMRMLTPNLRTFHITSARSSDRLGLAASEKLASARRLRQICISKCDLELEVLCGLLQILLERERGLETLAIASEDACFRSETLDSGKGARMLELLSKVDLRCLDLKSSVVSPTFQSAMQTAVAMNPAIRTFKI